jgi:hypothetical protein
MLVVTHEIPSAWTSDRGGVAIDRDSEIVSSIAGATDVDLLALSFGGWALSHPYAAFDDETIAVEASVLIAIEWSFACGGHCIPARNRGLIGQN